MLSMQTGGWREPHLHISTPAAFKDNVHLWCQEVFKMVRCADVSLTSGWLNPVEQIPAYVFLGVVNSFCHSETFFSKSGLEIGKWKIRLSYPLPPCNRPDMNSAKIWSLMKKSKAFERKRHKLKWFVNLGNAKHCLISIVKIRWWWLWWLEEGHHNVDPPW